MSWRGVAGWVGALVLFVSGHARAMTIQDIATASGTRVVHLSVRDALNQEVGSGSGFLISPDGRVVTNEHVVDGAERMVAVFQDQHEAKVTGVWAFDRVFDLAVIQLEPGIYETLTLAQEGAKPGEDIALVGSPRGLGNAISSGIVSAVRPEGIFKNDQSADSDERLRNWTLQLTAAASPGSSGSPILRADGSVIGIAVGIRTDMQGTSFGISVDRLQMLLRAAPKTMRPLNAATGVRTVQTNLMISGAVFLCAALMWVVGSKLLRKPSKGRAR